MNEKEFLVLLGSTLRELGDKMLARAGDAPAVASPAPAAEPRVMTITKYAKRVGYATSTVQRWVKMGLPHVPSGRGVRIKVEAADVWLEGGGAKATARVFSRAKDRVCA